MIREFRVLHLGFRAVRTIWLKCMPCTVFAADFRSIEVLLQTAVTSPAAFRMNAVQYLVMSPAASASTLSLDVFVLPTVAKYLSHLPAAKACRDLGFNAQGGAFGSPWGDVLNTRPQPGSGEHLQGIVVRGVIRSSRGISACSRC